MGRPDTSPRAILESLKMGTVTEQEGYYIIRCLQPQLGVCVQIVNQYRPDDANPLLRLDDPKKDTVIISKQDFNEENATTYKVSWERNKVPERIEVLKELNKPDALSRISKILSGDEVTR